MKIRKVMSLTIGMVIGVSAAGLSADNDANGRGSSYPGILDHPFQSKAVETLALGDDMFSDNIETQTELVRRQATAAQIKAAIHNAKTYYAELSPEKKLELKKKKIRYLAVPTVRSKDTPAAAREVVMIWDIPRESLVNKNVYEIDSTPPAGKLASFDDISAEYIGSKNMTQ
jgi:hypothetical protein